MYTMDIVRQTDLSFPGPFFGAFFSGFSLITFWLDHVRFSVFFIVFLAYFCPSPNPYFGLFSAHVNGLFPTLFGIILPLQPPRFTFTPEVLWSLKRVLENRYIMNHQTGETLCLLFNKAKMTSVNIGVEKLFDYCCHLESFSELLLTWLSANGTCASAHADAHAQMWNSRQLMPLNKRL